MDHTRATRAEAGLLASLQAPRQSHALDGKLKTVVVPSIDEYEHLGRAVQVRDSLPQAEVHSLPQEVRPIVGAPLAGIRAMKEDRRRRHESSMLDLEDFDRSLANRLVEAVEGAMEQFLASMKENDEDIDGRLEQLKNSRIAEIDEEGIQNVFNFMLDQRAVRASMFDRMANFLTSCDKESREYAKETIYAAIEALSSAAHIPDTSMQRLIEEVTHKANTTILKWRKTNADLVRRLRIRDIEMERARRLLSNDILIKWRRDRTNHAVAMFCKDLRSERFVRPVERTAVLEELTGLQDDCMLRVCAHLESATHLFPLKLRRQVDDWTGSCVTLLSAWSESCAVSLGRVREVEALVQRRAEDHFAVLVDEVKRYGYIPGDKVHGFLESTESGCSTSMEIRQESSNKVTELVRLFMDKQSEEWKAKMDALSMYMAQVQTLREDQRKSMNVINNTTKELLISQRSEHEDVCEKNESSFNAIISEIQVATSEGVMDKKVEEALLQLDLIEESYRSFHGLSSATLKKHVANVRAEADSYRKNLCKLLGLVNVNAESADQLPDPAEGPSQSITIGDGSCFPILLDLYETLFTKNTKAKADSEDPQQLVDAASRDAEDVEAEAAEASRSAAEAAAAVQEAEDAMTKEVESYLRSPHTSRSYTEVQRVATDLIHSILRTLRMAMLEDMCAMCEADISSAVRFISSSNEVMTNELDTLLRQHRPRAGRVEEEVRQECSVKLIQLRRKFDRQLRRAIKQLADNGNRVEDRLASLDQSIAKQIGKLKRLESSLASCMSVKSLTTRVREAKSTRDQLHELLRSECQSVRQFIMKQVEDVTEVKDNLHTFLIISDKDGDTKTRVKTREELLSQEGYETYAKQLDQLSRSIADQTESEMGSVKAAEERLAASIDDGYAHVESEIPRHETDLQFLEEFDSMLCSTRSKVRELISAGEVAEKELHDDVEHLKVAMQWGTSIKANERNENENAACQDLMAKLDGLRLRLLARCKSLKYMKSRISPAPINYIIDAAERADAVSQGKFVDKTPAQSKSSPKPAAKTASKTSKADKPGKKQPPSGSSRDADADADASSSLLSTVETLCDDCSSSLAETAEAFYTQKKEIKDAATASARPGVDGTAVEACKKRSRIPDTLEDFLSVCNEQLERMRSDARHHASDSVRALHETVIEVAELISKVPSVALKRLLSGKTSRLERALAEHRSSIYASRADSDARCDRLKSNIRTQMARNDRQRMEQESNESHDAAAQRESDQPQESLEAKEELLKEMLVEEEGLAGERLELEKDSARAQIRLLVEFEHDFNTNLQTLIRIVEEELSHIILPDDLPQEHTGPETSNESNLETASGTSTSLWSGKRKGYKKLLEQQAFGELGENETSVDGRPLSKLTWKVPEIDTLIRSIKMKHLVSAHPLKLVIDESLEAVELEDVDLTPSDGASDSAGDKDESTIFAITGLNCSCVHALVSARNDTLKAAAALMERAYKETREDLFAQTSQATNTTIKWKETIHQRQLQQKK